MSAREEGLFVPVWVLRHPELRLTTRYVLAVVLGLRHLLERGELTRAQVARIVRMSEKGLSEHTRKLRRAGIVRLIGRGHAPARWVFTLTEARRLARKGPREF